MFRGFENEEAWNHVSAEQNRYVQETCGMEPLRVAPGDVRERNEQAAESYAEIASMM
jgi:hypothetical protein